MRLLITGGLGFIGRACIPLFLGRGCRSIRVIDSLDPAVHGADPDLDAYTRGWGSEVEITVGSVTDPSVMAKALPETDAVLHLAALTSVPGSMADSARYSESNITGTARLRDALVAARGSVQRVVLASSRAVYGEGPYECPKPCSGFRPEPVIRSLQDFRNGRWTPHCPGCGERMNPLPASETSALHPTSVYGTTKLAQEQLLQSAFELGTLDPTELAVFRLQNVYGPGQSRAVPDVGVANIMAERILRGEGVRLYEDGEPVRDFVFIDDVANLLVDATLGELAADPSRLFNVGTGVGVSLRELAEILFRLAGSPAKISVSGEYRIGDIRHAVADVSKLAHARTWDPTPVEKGLDRLIASLRER